MSETELKPELVAKMAEQSRLSFRVKPAPGELMDASTVGGLISNFAKLMRACANGIPVAVLVEKLVTDDEGAIDVSVMVLRYAKATEHKRRVRARRTKP